MLSSTYFLAFVANILLIASASASSQPKCTRPNEVYIECIDGCNPNTCESIDRIYHCPLQRANKTCTGGCRCKPGYYRNKINQCISKKNCEKCTGPNEYYSCGGACDNVCATLAKRNQTSCDIVNVKCNDMCYCEEGHARNENGTCVPFNKCPKQSKCGKNEVLIPCLSLYCEPKTCEQKGIKLPCPDISPGIPCHQPACVCKRGYLRGPNGNCIPEAQCPPKCGTNEIYSDCINGGCFGAETCEEVGKVGTKCVKIDPKNCIKGCKCMDGYVRSDNGTCVAEEQCPIKQPKCTRPNEVYIECIDGCNPNTCESIDRIYHCPLQRANKTCTGGCRCKPGYYRNKINQCISEENCKKCTGPNEYYSCGGACDNVCATLAKRNQTSCDIVNVKCNDMCYCEEGHARNENGTCVPFNKCPKQTKCGKNEVLIPCLILYCEPKTCEQKLTKRPCPRISPGIPCHQPACVCKRGYLRGPNGNCIPEAQCPPKCGTNEIYSNCTNGGCFGSKTCKEKGKVGTKCVKIDSKNCIKGCKCMDSYVHSDNAPKCGTNEIYSDCINGGCFGAETCEEVGKVGTKCVKIDPKNCIKGCKCMDGYVRSDNGTCVAEEQCPIKPPQCGKLEVLNPCANGGCYRTRKCSDILRNSTICVDPIKCYPGCLCKKGYLRDKYGKCIPENQCPEKKCTGPNEYYSCGGACDNVCATLAKRNQTSCDIVNKKCTEMCYCDEGYARNENGTCVPFNQCPKPEPKCTRPNEVYIECIDGCNPNTCESIDRIYHCPLQRANKTCTGGCRCKPGYYRNKINQCISKKNCEKCTGPNEYYSCGGACDNVCATLAKRNQTSCDIVNVKCNDMCYCDEGHARNENGTCVPFNQCPKPAPKCRANEIYSNCINGGCFGARFCEEVGKVGTKCVKIDPKNCIKGCKCSDGHVRSDNGTCIPEDECPKKYHESCANDSKEKSSSEDKNGSEEETYSEKRSEDETYSGNESEDETYSEKRSEDETYTENESEEETYSEKRSEDETYSENESEEKTYSENASSIGEGKKYDNSGENNHEKNTNDYKKNGNNNSTYDCS